MMRVFVAFQIVLLAAPAYAELKKSDLDRKVVLTEEAALLSQVDAVSLYLTSDRVAFAPRLTKEGIVEVEATVLAPDLIANKGRMRELVERLIGTYISVLKERLPIYAPAVAKRFNPEGDIVFIVNAGVARVPVGVWKGGAWQEGGQASVWEVPPQASGAAEIIEARAMESEDVTGAAGRKGCRCPARR